jgi:hypothetical protein
VHDSLRMFPVAPDRITNVEGPVIKVQKVGKACAAAPLGVRRMGPPARRLPRMARGLWRMQAAECSDLAAAQRGGCRRGTRAFERRPSPIAQPHRFNILAPRPQINDHAVDVRLTQGFRASFSEPLDDVGARAAAAYGSGALRSGDGDGPLLASCPACSCTVTEHTDDSAVTGRDGRPLPATSECWVSEPVERGDSGISVSIAAALAAAGGARAASPAAASGASGSSAPSSAGGLQLPTVVSVESGGGGPASCGPDCRHAAAGGARVEEVPSSDCEQDTGGFGSDVDPAAGDSARQQQQQQQHQPAPHPRRSRHHPELAPAAGAPRPRTAGASPGAGALVALSPLDAAAVASPARLTALSTERPPRAPRCEWELDPRKVLVGRRLAVGGFAEVFIGKYEVRAGRGDPGLSFLACWAGGSPSMGQVDRRCAAPCAPLHHTRAPHHACCAAPRRAGHGCRRQAPAGARPRHYRALRGGGYHARARAPPQPHPVHRLLHHARAVHRAGGAGRIDLALLRHGLIGVQLPFMRPPATGLDRACRRSFTRVRSPAPCRRPPPPQEYMGRGSLYSIIDAARGPEPSRPAVARGAAPLARAPTDPDAPSRPGAPLDPKLQRSVAVGVARGMAYLHTVRRPRAAT